MDFDFDKQMKIDGKASASSSQRNTIYKEQLNPLKAKISQILLYDTETALQLLQEYNEIAKRGEDIDIATLLGDIANLEIKIQEYENSTGKEMLFKEQSVTISNQLDDLQVKSKQMDIGELESKFSEIKELYNKNLENYSYTDRDAIEQKISVVQAKIIMEKVRAGALDLHDEISKDDEARLTMTINNSIFTLMQSQNPNIQDIVNEIKYKMIDRTDAVYDPEIWRLLDSAQGNGEKIENRRIETQKTQVTQATPTTTLLPAIPIKRKGFRLPDFKQIFSRDTIKIGNRRMKISNTVEIIDMTVKAKELSKIGIDWLAKDVSLEMLSDIEDEKLKEEGNEKVKEKYVPDKRTPIYDFFSKKQETSLDNKFTFFEFGRKEYIEYNYICSRNTLVSYYAINISGIHKMSLNRIQFKKINNIRGYANFIDIVKGCKLLEQVNNEIGNFLNEIHSNKCNNIYIDIEEELKKLPIYSNLLKSYEQTRIDVEKDEGSFRGREKAKREKFYREQQFKENLKVICEGQDKENGEVVTELLNGFHKKQIQQNNSVTEKTNEENGDGTEYRGG